MRVKIPIVPPVVNSTSKSKAYIDSLWGEISARYGIKTISDGTQWVVHCLTGEPLERKNANAVQGPGGVILWIPKGYHLSSIDFPKIYVWNNPKGKGTI